MSRYQTSKHRWLITAALVVAAPIILGVALFLHTRYQRDKVLERLGEIESVAMYEDLWRAQLGQEVDLTIEYELYGYTFTIEEARESVGRMKTLRSIATDWNNTNWDRYQNRFDDYAATPSDQDYRWLQNALRPTWPLNEELVSEANRTGPLFALEIDRGHDMPLPHLAEFRGLARILAARARMQAYEGDYTSAAETIRAIVDLGDRLATEPTVISQLVRIAISGIAYEAVAEFMPESGLSEDARAILLTIPDPVRFRPAFADAVRFEGIMAHRSLVGIRRDPALFDTLYGTVNDDWGERLFRRIYASPIGAPLANRDEYQTLSILAELAEAIDNPGFDQAETYHRLSNRVQGLPSQYRMTHQTAAGLPSAPAAMLRAEVLVQLMKLGLLIEAYRDTHGQWPESLHEIEIHGELTIDDPFSEEPLRYRIDNESFHLYSLGTNKTDEGGIHNWREGDWVWRFYKNHSLPRDSGARSTTYKRKPGWSSGDAISGR